MDATSCNNLDESIQLLPPSAKLIRLLVFPTPCPGDQTERPKQSRNGERALLELAKHLREVGLPVPSAKQSRGPHPVENIWHARLQGSIQQGRLRQSSNIQARSQLQQLYWPKSAEAVRKESEKNLEEVLRLSFHENCVLGREGHDIRGHLQVLVGMCKPGENCPSTNINPALQEVSKFARTCAKNGGFFKCCVSVWNLNYFEIARNKLISEGLIKAKATKSCKPGGTKDPCVVCQTEGVCTTMDTATGMVEYIYHKKYKPEHKVVVLIEYNQIDISGRWSRSISQESCWSQIQFLPRWGSLPGASVLCICLLFLIFR